MIMNNFFIYVYTYMYIDMCVYIHTCIYIYIYICMYVYMYMFIQVVQGQKGDSDTSCSVRNSIFTAGTLYYLAP